MRDKCTLSAGLAVASERARVVVQCGAPAATRVHCQPSLRSFRNGEGENDYGSKAIDRIGLCGRAGFQRLGGRCCSSHRAAPYCGRETGATAQPHACVDFRVPPLGWQCVRLDGGKVGTASTTGRPLGSPSLGSPAGRLCPGGGTLAVSPPFHGRTPHAGRWQHRHVDLITPWRQPCFVPSASRSCCFTRRAMRKQAPSRPAERPPFRPIPAWTARPW